MTTVVQFPIATPAVDLAVDLAGDLAGDLDLRVLGTIELHVAGQDRTPTPAKLRALLVTLALQRGRRMTTEALIDELWETPPRTARNVVHSYVAALRRLLVGSSAQLTYEAGGYRLVLPAGTSDVERFTRAVEADAVDDEPGQRTRLEAALAVWRGDPVPDLRLGSRTEAVLAELTELRTTLVERRAVQEVAAGQPDRAIAALRGIVAAEPLREHTWGQLIEALAASGRWAEALLAYGEVRSLVADELGVEPSAPLRDLHQRLLAHGGPVAASPGGTHRRSPPVAEPPPLLGRDAERAELRLSLTAHRLVCLTGPAGVGKTALALDTVHRRGSVLGVVEVADCRDRRDMLRAVGEAMGSSGLLEPTMDDLMRTAGDLSGLLVLDGCDALLPACAELVAALLRTSPRLRVLATSQAPLRVRGEYRIAVRRLEIPSRDASVLAHRASPAVHLLIERARANGWRARLDPVTVLGLGRIARELDGLPLALELAAERLVRLPVERLHDRLTDRFQVLRNGPRCVPERHRTLEAAVAADHALLQMADQALFARLRVFHGPFTPDDVFTVVCTPDSSLAEVEDALERLIASSVLQPADPSSSSGPMVLTNTARSFATERRSERPDDPELRDRHAAWVRDLLTEVRGTRDRADEHRFLQLREGDLIAACAQALTRQDGPTATALVEAAWWHWYLVGDLRRGLDRMRGTLGLPGVADSPAGARIRVRAAWFAHLLGDATSARIDARRADAAFVRTGDPHGAGLARAMVALTSVASDPQTAVRLATEALDLHRRVGDQRAIASSARTLGSVLASTGDLERADALAVEGERRAARLADPHGTSAAAQLRSDIAVRRGDLAEARRHLARGLEASIAAHHTLGTAMVVARLSRVVLAAGDPAAAAELLGAARLLEWRTGCTIDPALPEPLNGLEVQLRRALGAAEIERLQDTGAEELPADLARLVLASGRATRHRRPSVAVDRAVGDVHRPGH